MSQLYDKPEQPDLSPGGKPIVQIAERPNLQQSQIIHNLKQDKNLNTRRLYISVKTRRP